MLIYEYITPAGNLAKIMFRVSTEQEKDTLELKTYVRYTKSINNTLHHLTKEINSNITHNELMSLTKRVAQLDNIFWKL